VVLHYVPSRRHPKSPKASGDLRNDSTEHPSAAGPRIAFEIGQVLVPEDKIRPICLKFPASRLRGYSTQRQRSEIKEVIHSTGSAKYRKDG
jgi:hypothetical protein